MKTNMNKSWTLTAYFKVPQSLLLYVHLFDTKQAKMKEDLKYRPESCAESTTKCLLLISMNMLLQWLYFSA